MAAQDVKLACLTLTATASDSKLGEALARDALRAINSCSRQHIEQCTTSTIRFMRSTESAISFSRFLIALSKSFSASAKRLHILLVLSDVLLAIRRHRDPLGVLGIVKRHVPLLLILATYGDPVKDAKTYPEVMDLIGVWYDSQVITPDETVGLYERVLETDAMSYSRTWEQAKAHVAEEETNLTQKLEREREEAKWVLPKRNGVPHDPAAPWYELPAANGLYMKRTRGYPMKSYAFPQGGYELDSGVERWQLKKDVEKLHSEMLHAFDKYTIADDVQDVDAMGNIIYKDADRPTRNYWGWSLDLIDKRKQLGKDFQNRATGYADIPPPRRAPPSDPAVDRARRLAAEQRGGTVGMGGRGGRGGYGHPRGGMGSWRGGGEFIGSGPRGGRGY